MLLQQLYDLAHAKEILADPAFEEKTVRWLIALDLEGNLLGAGPKSACNDGNGKNKSGKKYKCPRIKGSKNSGGISEFLVDGLTAVFGLVDDLKKPISDSTKGNNKKKHIHFWKQIDDAAKATGHSGLAALLKFREMHAINTEPTFLRWGAKNDGKSTGMCSWWIRLADGSEERLNFGNFTFEVEGELLLENENIRRFWRETYKANCEQSLEIASKGVCLITGQKDKQIARRHHLKIRGVPNTSSFGAAIVSFDKDAFASYEFEESKNASISDEAAMAYCAALNWLLEQPNHHIRIGQSEFCFWVKEKEQILEADIFIRLLESPKPQEFKEFLKSTSVGYQRDMTNSDQFFAVILTGNSGRIVVRHWLQQPLFQTIDNFQEWFSDLDLLQVHKEEKKKQKNDAKKSSPPLAISRLAYTTVREPKDLQSDVLTQLYRAAFERTAPSVSLLKAILKQLHSQLLGGKKYSLRADESRFALLKLIINRNRKETDMVIKPELTAETTDPAYNCGRLLAIFDELQQNAHEWKLEGATIVGRYFSSASTAPMTAFGILWRLHIHHLKKLSRRGDKGQAAAKAIERKIQNICANFGQTEEMRQKLLAPTFPRTLDLQAQGRFALGFYQQKAADYANRKCFKGNLDPIE